VALFADRGRILAARQLFRCQHVSSVFGLGSTAGSSGERQFPQRRRPFSILATGSFAEKLPLKKQSVIKRTLVRAGR
jgi:hypothetical protein